MHAFLRMKRVLIAAMTVLAVEVFAMGATSAQTASPEATSTHDSPKLDAEDLGAWLDGQIPYALKTGDIAGAVVVVVKDGRVLLKKGYGLSDVAARAPMDPDRSMMRIGSTSKLFTWTAVMQLVQQGKLDLDRNVNDLSLIHI